MMTTEPADFEPRRLAVGPLEPCKAVNGQPTSFDAVAASLTNGVEPILSFYVPLRNLTPSAPRCEIRHRMRRHGVQRAIPEAAAARHRDRPAARDAEGHHPEAISL